MEDNFGGYDPNKKSGGFNRSKRFYLKDGSNLYRVLPPVKSLREKNKIAQYWSVIWLTDTRGKKRPVASILKKQGKDIILQHDPLLTKYEELLSQMTQINAALKDPATAGQVDPVMAAAIKSDFNRIRPSKTYALNVIDASGAVGVLEIGYNSWQALDQKINQLNTQGIDAIGIGPDKGIYFDFRKVRDERGKSVYSVDPAMKTTKDASGNFQLNYIRMALTNEDAARLANQVEDLTTLYKEYTLEEQSALATLDQRMFDAVFARPSQDQQQQAPIQSVQPQYTPSPKPNVPMGVTVQQPSVVSVGGYVPSVPPVTTVTTQPQYTPPPQAPATVAVQTPVQAAPTTPSPFGNFQQGNVANNPAVKNFLFPETKKA